jgi:O-antigen/teichoic acid export membrane protein
LGVASTGGIFLCIIPVIETVNQSPDTANSNTTTPLLEPLKRLSSQSLIYGIGHVATRIISFLLLPFYTHLITPAEYGEVTLLFIFIAVVHVFYVYGFDISFLRYYVMEDDPTQRRRLFGATMMALTATSLILTAAIFLTSDTLVSVVFKHPIDIALKARLIRLCGAILFFDTIAVFPFLVLRGQQKPTLFSLLKLANVVLTILLNIWLVAVWRWGIEGIFWANFWASLCTMIAVFLITARHILPAFSWDMIRRFAAFGFPNIPTLFFVMIIELSDRKILELIRGAEEVGLYTTGYKMGMFMAIVANAFRFAWQPFFLDHAKKPDAQRTFARVLTYYIWITCFLFLALIYFINPIIRLKLPLLNSSLIEPGFWAGMAVFPIILAAHIVDGIYANFTVGIYIKKKTHFMPLVTGVAAALNIGGNLLLIPTYGMFGAAWTTVLSMLVMTALLYLMIQPHYPVPYEWNRILRIVLVTAALTIAFYLFPTMSLLLRLVLLLIFPVAHYLVGFFNAGEKQTLNHAWVKFTRAGGR